MELLFWLEEWGYDGYSGLEILPSREDSDAAVERSMKNIGECRAMPDRVDQDELRECFRGSDATKINGIPRRMLGAE